MEVDRIDGELAKADLADERRSALEAERDILQQSATYLGGARARNQSERRADRAAGPPVLDDPREPYTQLLVSSILQV